MPELLGQDRSGRNHLLTAVFSKQELSMADRVPPDATADEGTTNEERASWAEVALLGYGQRTGTVGETVGDDEDPFLIIGDLLADLAHWCDRHDVDLQAALQYATGHYRTETRSEGRQLM
jgi:hypothetical protein